MSIRKGKLRKPCARCGESFVPMGRDCKLCNKCNPQKNTWLDELVKNKK